MESYIYTLGRHFTWLVYNTDNNDTVRQIFLIPISQEIAAQRVSKITGQVYDGIKILTRIFFLQFAIWITAKVHVRSTVSLYKVIKSPEERVKSIFNPSLLSASFYVFLQHWHPLLFFHVVNNSFNKYQLRSYCVSGTILVLGGMVLAFMELTF